MPELGPGGKWVVMRDIPADPGGSMAVISGEPYRAPCQAHNPGMPVYSKDELALLKRVPKNAELFRGTQRIKRVFPSARVVDVKIGGVQ